MPGPHLAEEALAGAYPIPRPGICALRDQFPQGALPPEAMGRLALLRLAQAALVVSDLGLSGGSPGPRITGPSVG